MLKDVLERIEKRLRTLGTTAQAASLSSGLSKDAIRNMRRAQDSEQRGVNTRTLQALAPVLRTNTRWLLDGSGSEDALDSEVPPNSVAVIDSAVAMIPVVGFVEAGAWREEEYFESLGLGEMPFPVTGMPADSLYVLEVHGNSMDQIVPTGTRVICAQLDAVEPRDGDMVHVRRERAGLYESTLKKVHLTENGLELRTASNDPEWRMANGGQTVIRIDSDEADAEARIIGVVVYEIRRLRD